MNFKKLLILSSFIMISVFSKALKREPKKASLMTRFSKDVNPLNVLPEYPRPHMAWRKWLNLDGLWQFHAGS